MNWRNSISWAALVSAIIIPTAIAAYSPLLAWRDWIYILASFAGIIALALLLVQPLLIGAYLPGLHPRQSRIWHRWLGLLLVGMVALHIGGLWITSPPDVIDVLLLRSPTPFSIWGLLAMWGVILAAVISSLGRKHYLEPRIWRTLHKLMAAIAVTGTVVHAILIEGLMGQISKIALCVFVVAATAKVLWRFRHT